MKYQGFPFHQWLRIRIYNCHGSLKIHSGMSPLLGSMALQDSQNTLWHFFFFFFDERAYVCPYISILVSIKHTKRHLDWCLLSPRVVG